MKDIETNIRTIHKDMTAQAVTRSSKGILYMLSAALLFAVLTYLIKILGPRYRVWDIAMFRFFGSALLLLLMFGGHRLFTSKNYPLMFARGIIGATAFLAVVMSLKLIPMSTAMVLFYSFPAFSAIFSPLLFKERIAIEEIGCVVAALIGVGILFDFKLGGSILGQFMGVLGGFLAGLTVAIIKKLREDHGSANVYFYLCFMGTCVCAVPFLNDPRLPHAFSEITIVGGIVVTSTMAQLLMNRGFGYCKSWEGGTFLTSEVLFTSLIGILILGEAASWRFAAGGILIFASAVALSFRNYKEER